MRNDSVPPIRTAAHLPSLRDRIAWIVAVCLLAFSPVGQTHAESIKSSADRPNVVILLADDAGWGDFSSSGNRSVSTPCIDSLASSGAKFDRFFVCPVCSPTRAELLTGRYHPRGGVRGVSEGAERLNLDEVTLAQWFQANGYATGCFGKWHNGSQGPYHPRARGFDEYFGYTEGHWGEYFNPPLENQEGRMVSTQGYIVDVLTDRALDFIERKHKQPFLCFVPFTTPHSPWGVPASDWKRFQNKEIVQSGRNRGQEKLDETRCALAMLENQDRNVGRILDKLDSLQIADNTIVIYFSDNGPNTERWNGGMKGRKASVDEGGVRSVCYCRWPSKIAAGNVVQPIAAAIDWLPTLVSLAQLPGASKEPLDGIDLSPWLLAKQPSIKPTPDRILYSTWNGKISARSQRYRMDSDGKLFDMEMDPNQNKACELTSEAERIAFERLESGIRAWKEEVLQGGKLPKDSRPIPIGYSPLPITHLPARDGIGTSAIRRSAPAPNSSYFVNWQSTDDHIEWNVSVENQGTYRAAIDFTCPQSSVGAVLQLAFGSARLEKKLESAWDPPLYDDQDTIERPKAESRMKPFQTLELGKIVLSKGEGKLQLRAMSIPDGTVIDLRRLTLEYEPSDAPR